MPQFIVIFGLLLIAAANAEAVIFITLISALIWGVASFFSPKEK